MADKKVFAVINCRGPNWRDGRPMEEQAMLVTAMLPAMSSPTITTLAADQMNAMTADGFMLLGGPLVGTRDVLLVVRAADEAEIEARLGADCWTINGLLRTLQVTPWWLRLGSLGP